MKLTPNFIKEFAAYLTAERGLKNATIWLNCMWLTEDEIKRIMAHEFDNPTLVLVRDLFIFACFTALSFVDMKELTTDEPIGREVGIRENQLLDDVQTT